MTNELWCAYVNMKEAVAASKRYQIIDNKIMPSNDENTHTKYAHTHFRSKVLYGLYVNEEILWIIQ